MELSATDFRKDLFRILDKALHGELVEINYKGSKLRLVAPGGKSKLAGAVRRHALAVDPQSIVESDPDLMAAFENIWARDDKDL